MEKEKHKVALGVENTSTRVEVEQQRTRAKQPGTEEHRELQKSTQTLNVSMFNDEQKDIKDDRALKENGWRSRSENFDIYNADRKAQELIGFYTEKKSLSQSSTIITKKFKTNTQM